MISGDFVPLLIEGLLCKQKRELVPIVVPHQRAAAAPAQRAAEAAAAPVAQGRQGPGPRAAGPFRAQPRSSGLQGTSRLLASGPPGLLPSSGLLNPLLRELPAGRARLEVQRWAHVGSRGGPSAFPPQNRW